MARRTPKQNTTLFSQDFWCQLAMLSSSKVADFTTRVSNSVVCQHCFQSSKDGTELYHMQDSKSDQRGGKESVQNVVSTTLEK